MHVLLVQAMKMSMKVAFPGFNMTMSAMTDSMRRIGRHASNLELTSSEAKFLDNIDSDNKVAMNTLVKIVESKVGWKHVNLKDGYNYSYIDFLNWLLTYSQTYLLRSCC